MSDNKSGLQRSNENISVQANLRPGCVVEMKVSVSPIACAAAFERAKKEVRKEASIPGFRKGKIPDEILSKHFGEEITKRARSLVATTSFDEGVRLIGREPFSRNSIRRASVLSCTPEKGAEIVLEYEALPSVPGIDIDNLNLDYMAPAPTTDDQLTERYESLQYIHSERTKVTDRPAQAGDEIVCTVTPSEDAAHPFYKEEDFFLKRKHVPDWLFDAACGMQTGETKDVVIASTSDEASPIPAKLTIHDIYACTLPEENEEFAKKCGTASIEDLRSNIALQLSHNAQLTAFERVRRQLKNELIRLYAFDLPQTLVESETEARFQPYLKSLTEDNKAPTDVEGLRKSFLDEVKRQFTLYFLLQPLFATLNPTYTQKELFEEMMYQTKGVPVTHCVLNASLSADEFRNRLVINIALRKCEDYLLEKRLGIKPPTP